MAQVTSPIILDSTGQQIHSDLQQIKAVLTTPSAAEDITFDNTGTGMQADDVQDAITELKSNLIKYSTHVIKEIKKVTKSVNVANTSASVSPYNRFGAFDVSDVVSSNEVIIGLNAFHETGNVPLPCAQIDDGRVAIVTTDGRLNVKIVMWVAVF